MGKMNLSLPKPLHDFVDAQADEGGFASTGEYVRDLVRREKDRQKLRALLIEGAESAATEPVGEAWFAALRKRARRDPE